MKYVLGLGTNIGDRAKNLKQAINALDLVPKTKVLKASAVYETQPVGYADQQDFYNIVVLVESEFEPKEMLGICMGIEAGFGRVREIKNGPRILDIDLIFAENLVIDSKNLIVPHPRYNQRRFVLEPLMDIFQDGVAFGFDFNGLSQKIENQDIKKTEIKIL